MTWHWPATLAAVAAQLAPVNAAAPDAPAPPTVAVPEVEVIEVENVRKVFEAAGDPIDHRFDALARCRAAGLHTFGVIQPMLPMNADRLVERMAPLVSAVRIDRMYEMSRSRPLYESIGRTDAMHEEFFEQTRTRLRRGFESAGVAIDTFDDLGSALGLP